ncbi:MAG: hypothetical protein GY696_31430, partial [Gammaproteobacteria bacterium]|nr:hypothetical protein [Gammaproteobacteria bacterium]
MVDIISGAETSTVTSGIGGGGGEPPTPGIPLEDGINLSEGTFSGAGLLLVSIESFNWRSCFSYDSDIKGESEDFVDGVFRIFDFFVFVSV